MSDASRREFYRLRYPIKLRPQFESLGCQFPVTELSERGFRILAIGAVPNIPHGTRLSGQLHLPGGAVDVQGSMARIEGQEIILVAVQGVSFGCLLAEQRRIAAQVLG